MKRCLLLLLAVIITGCSQANMRGNETVRHYNITINNDNQSLLVVDMPLQVDAITSEKTDMTADNDPATDVSTPISLAAQGATASTAAKDATQQLSEILSDYKQWQDFRKEHSDNVTNPEPTPTPPEPELAPTPPEPEPEIPPEPGVEPDPSSPIQPGIPTVTEWLHTDVSGWTVTADLQSVSTTSSTISLPYDKAKVWPPVTKGSGTIVNANPWVMVQAEPGKWYAATWEWLRPGQTTKSKSSVAGDHIKKSPLKDWVPKKGEVLYFMVSGLARDSTRNVEERSQWVKYIWE